MVPIVPTIPRGNLTRMRPFFAGIPDLVRYAMRNA
jgi:hypothetical protein